MELSKEFLDSLTKEEREFILSWKELKDDKDFGDKFEEIRRKYEKFR